MRLLAPALHEKARRLAGGPLSFRYPLGGPKFGTLSRSVVRKVKAGYSPVMNPVIDTALCSRCGLCAEDCMRHLIDPATLAIGDIPCAACGHCVAICPTAAISLEGGDSALTTISAPNSYENLVLMRRSVRHYQAAELSREHIKRMLELARFAPTGTNTEAVTVTVLATRNRVAAAAAIALRHYQGMARLLNPVTVFLARPFLGKGLASKVLGYKKHLVQASASGKDPFAHGCLLYTSRRG